jgi:predicted metal-binding protein
MTEKLVSIALECGFSHAGSMDVSKVVLREEVRATCAVNKCKAYDANWSCPPACGTLAECGERLRKYQNGIILQTTGALEDSFDYEGMQALGKKHSVNLGVFGERTEAMFPVSMLLGAGACSLCRDMLDKPCSYPGSPCRYPRRMHHSMEAFGMVVSDVCTGNGIAYYYGSGTLTYVGCFLF